MKVPSALLVSLTWLSVAASSDAMGIARPNQSREIVVVAEGSLARGDREVAQGSTYARLGVEAHIEFPASKDLDRPARLSILVDRDRLGVLSAAVSAIRADRVVATATKELDRSSTTVELDADGFKWTVKMKVKPQPRDREIPLEKHRE